MFIYFQFILFFVCKGAWSVIIYWWGLSIDHIRKDIVEFVDERSRRTHVSFLAIFSPRFIHITMLLKVVFAWIMGRISKNIFSS